MHGDDDSFLAIVTGLQLLPQNEAETLVREAQAEQVPATEMALRQGLISAGQIEVVHTLMRPLEVVPGYEILDLLGQGGMGAVYRARQLTLDREVAIKMMIVGKEARDEFIQRFEREARTVARLQHPNIIQAFDFGQAKGRFYLVMELVIGETLAAFARRRQRLSEPLAWPIVRQIAAGLAYAASQGVIHRDIKPANVLLLPAPPGYHLPPAVPMVKIADFGLARLAVPGADDRDAVTKTGTAVGTPDFMAPEQLQAFPVDHRADIYALGVVAYQLLSGALPLNDQPPSQRMLKKMAGYHPRLDAESLGLSTHGVDLVYQMMEPEVDRRPADYAALLAQIDALPSQQPRADGTFPTELREPYRAVAAATSNTPTLTRIPKPESSAPVLGSGSAGPSEPTLVFVGDAAGSLRPRGADRFAVAQADPERDLANAATLASPARRFAAAKQGPALVLVLTLILLALGAAYFFRDQPAPVVRQFVEFGRSEPLFLGDSLGRLQPLSGHWQPTKSREGAPVVQGRSGAARQVLQFADGTAPANFAVHLEVELVDNAVFEVEFGHAPAETAPQDERYVLRLADGQAQVGRRRGSDRYVPESPALALGEISRYVVSVERHHNRWLAFVDDQGVAAVAAQATDQPMITLQVLRGTIQLSEFTLAEFR